MEHKYMKMYIPISDCMIYLSASTKQLLRRLKDLSHIATL